MVAVAMVFAFIVFVGISLNGLTQFWSFYISWTIVVPALPVFGCWAALGMGAMWLRVTVFSLLGPMLFVAAIAGFYASQFWGGMAFLGVDWMSPFELAFAAALLTFGCCVACQVPFWILRLAFGWQLIQTNCDWSQKKISIKDMFLLTAIFAFAIALPRFGTDIFWAKSINEVQVGQVEYVVELDADGVPVQETIEITEENIEEFREKRRMENGTLKTGMLMGLLVYAAIVAVLALVFAPAVWLTLRMSASKKGVLFATIYLLALCLVSGGLIVFFSFGNFVMWGQVIPYMIGLAILFVAAAIIPLAVSRRRGIRLVSNRDFRERRMKESNAVQ